MTIADGESTARDEAATAADSKANNMGSVSALDALELDEDLNASSYVSMLVEKQRHYNVPEHQIFKVCLLNFLIKKLIYPKACF